MSSLDVEAFREDVDNLTAAILAVVISHTESLPAIDRDIIVAAATANVVCRVDTVSLDRNGGVVANPHGATGRLQRVVGAWK